MKKLDNYLKSLNKHAFFRGAVLVSEGNKIIFCQAYDNSVKTIFQIGSLTKQFTAAAILKLGLNLDQSILSYLPGEYQARAWEKITLRQLLEHQSGIFNYTEDRSYFNKRMTTEKLIKNAMKERLRFTPGSKREYSNTGYLLLGVIIEAQSGMSYGEYLKKEFFKPLGMDHTGVYEGRPVPRRAVGYCFDKKGIELVEDHSESIEATLSDGAIYSTVEDFHKWCLQLPDLPFGLDKGTFYGRSAIGHSGVIAGFNADFCLFPQEKIHIIVLGNNVHFHAGYILGRVGKLLFRGEDPSPAVPFPDDFYFNARYGDIEFYQKKGRLLLSGPVTTPCAFLENERLFSPYFGSEFQMEDNRSIVVYNAFDEPIDKLNYTQHD